jgi:hypothetical protein
MDARTPRDTRTLHDISQARFARFVRIATIIGLIFFVGWLGIVAHFVWKFW